jgi:hypothetical protein
VTPDEAHAQLVEAKTRQDIMQVTVELMNMFGQFLSCESGTELEAALEEGIDQYVQELVAGTDGMIGHVLLSLLALLCECGDHERVQEFLNDAAEDIKKMVEEANRDHTH